MKLMKLLSVIFCFVVSSLCEEQFNYTEENLIVGGELTEISQHPYQVLLTSEEQDFFCGGAIISKSWVVTAAHCVERKEPPSLRVLAGSSYMFKGKQHRIANVIIHEKYSGRKTKRNDIAVLQVQLDFVFNDNIQPISLIHSGYNLKTGTPLTATGWGRIVEDGPTSEQLRKVTLYSITNEQCQKMLKNEFLLIECMFCATVDNNVKDTCQGDSGGPLVNEDGLLVGLVSSGIGCARPNLPGYYTRLSCYRDWIRKHTGI